MVGLNTSLSGLPPVWKNFLMAGQATAIVDSKGRGMFRRVQDGIDYVEALIAAGDPGGSVWIRSGSYIEVLTIAQINIMVEGESWDVVIDGETTGHVFNISAGRVCVKGIQGKTTAGGGTGFNVFQMTGGCDLSQIKRCYIPECDNTGIQCDATAILIESCEITGCDGSGVNMGSGGDNSKVHLCHIYSNGAYGTSEAVDAENCVYVGNRVSANSSGQIQQASGTGTYVGNDET